MSMSTNSKDYIKKYRIASVYFCKEIVSLLEDKIWLKHRQFNHDILDHEKVADASKKVLLPQLQQLRQLTEDIMKTHINYITTELSLYWFDSRMGFMGPRIHRFNVESNMSLHCDHNPHIFKPDEKGIPVFTAVCNLNDDYEGGELYLFENEKVELKAGEIIIFPSNFMYPYHITTVTSGTKYGFTGWWV